MEWKSISFLQGRTKKNKTKQESNSNVYDLNSNIHRSHCFFWNIIRLIITNSKLLAIEICFFHFRQTQDIKMKTNNDYKANEPLHPRAKIKQ